MNPRKNALLKVHLGYFCMGLTSSLVKAISWDPLSIVFTRMLIAGLLLASIVYAKSHQWKIAQKDIKTVIVSGMLFTIHWLTFFFAIKVSNVPTAAVGVTLIPVCSALIEPLVHKHKPSKIDSMLAICAVCATFIIIENFSLADSTTLGILLSVVSAITKSFRDIMSHILVSSYGSLQVMSYQMLVGVIILLPFIRPTTLEWTPYTIGNVLVIAIIGTALAHTLCTAGFKSLKAVTVNLLGMLTTLYQIIFGILLVHNIPSARVLIGGTIVLCISSFETWRNSQKR